LLRPFLVLAPVCLLYPFWRKLSTLPAPPAILAIWVVSTVSIAWWIALTADDRQVAVAAVRRLLYRRAVRT
jgi:hypothetical protein